MVMDKSVNDSLQTHQIEASILGPAQFQFRPRCEIKRHQYHWTMLPVNSGQMCNCLSLTCLKNLIVYLRYWWLFLMAVASPLFFLQQERRDCSLIWDGSFLSLNRPATTAAVRIQVRPLPGKGFHMMLWLGEQAIKPTVLRKEKAMLLLLIFKCITDKCCLKKTDEKPWHWIGIHSIQPV